MVRQMAGARVPGEVVSFLIVVTKSALALTGAYMSKRLTLAAQVNGSDCLFVSDGSGGLGLKRVTSTRRLTDTGIYTAITKNPYLVRHTRRLRHRSGLDAR
jgi:site-specific recombinase XerD